MSHIILIGFMGSGKTTLGASLAVHLEREFIDSDQYIEERTGMSVSQIFETEGEQNFRELEQDAVRAFFDKDECVISVGGGLPEIPGMMEQLNALGTTIFLHVSEKELIRRLLLENENRPLLKSLSEPELRNFVKDRYDRRKKMYKQAKVIVSSDSISVSDLLKKLRHAE
jgi:shikimate kinase